MSHFDNLLGSINDGREGKNQGLITGFNRLDNFISLKKKMMITVIGASGSGKSSFVNNAFILNPCQYAFENNKKLKIILFSMERSMIYTHAKWLVGKMFETGDGLIPMSKLLGWGEDRITDRELARVQKYKGWMESLPIDVYEGQRSPNDIYRIVMTYAESVGRKESEGEFKQKYIPNDPDEQVIVIVDHVGLTKVLKQHHGKKGAIDDLIEKLQYLRDFLGYTIIPVAQLNRDLSNPIYKKLESFEPHFDNIKETGNLGEASDIILSLWEPLRYNTTDKNYGDVSKFRCPTTGNKYFRSISILKNTYDVDGVSIGTVFMGATGKFKELPKSKTVTDEWKDENFQDIFNNSYFLT